VNLLCPLSGDGNLLGFILSGSSHSLTVTDDPLIGFAFLRTFTDILQSYFDNISATVIRNNFDVVYQLLEETLEAKTTSLASLRDIVLPPSLLNKLLSATNFTSSLNSSLNSSAGTGAFNSAIPWRKTGVRYAHNEIYFDVIERMDAIVNKCV
jgi:AP-3 complex subunit mu